MRRDGWLIAMPAALALFCGPALDQGFNQGSGQARAAGQQAEDGAVFARVNGVVISREEFEINVQAGLQQRFYHGRASGEQLVRYRRDIGRQLIERLLLDAEANRRGIKADREAVEARIAQTEARYRHSEGWREQRKALLASLREKLETDSRIDRLQRQVRDVPVPQPQEVRAFYRDNPALFTTPERVHLGLILLRVEPWAQTATWQAALDEAQRLAAKIKRAADPATRFAGLARLHSADDSARRGGDLGFVHKGMLADEAQAVVDRLKPGELSVPVRMLQGIALFRLEARAKPQLNALEKVSERASELLQREQAKQAWDTLRERLYQQAEVQLDERLFQGGIDTGGAVQH